MILHTDFDVKYDEEYLLPFQTMSATVLLVVIIQILMNAA